jgi:hypothetical protein
MLRDFVRLADASDSDLPRRVSAFARQYGVLDVCVHGLPITHAATTCFSLFPEACRRHTSTMLQEAEFEYRVAGEPLRAWRFFAQKALSLLEIVAMRQSGDRPTDDDWKAAVMEFEQPDPGDRAVASDLYLLPAFFTGGFPSESQEDSGFALSLLVEQWLLLGAVRPRPVLRPTESRIAIGSYSTFGALASQLLLAAGCGRGVAFCAFCGSLFEPADKAGRPRRPQAGRNAYCAPCRKKNMPQRDASRRQRERKKQRKEDGP